ncbi:MAG: type VI secretion system transmembrane protein TssQ [Tannerellaceae bacterium]|nr:type VI secretion system transmembrane protein TssQ [Tannerellaceae bacterium]
MKRIEIKTGEYDHIYTYQTEIVEKVDSLYSYMTLLNSSDRINDIAVQGIISNRKMNLLEHLNRMYERDSRVYHRLVGQVNTFLSLKDSIRRLSVQEELLRNDLLRCVQDNRQTNRRLTLEGGK